MENGEEVTQCAISAKTRDEEISKYFDISRGVAGRCTISLTQFKLFISDLMRARKEARQKVKVREGTVSGGNGIRIDFSWIFWWGY